LIVHFFNHNRSKINDKILFLYNAFYRGNLTNDIVNSSNDNSNSNNSNSNNSNSNNSNSNNSNSNNSYSNNSNSNNSNSNNSNSNNSYSNNSYSNNSNSNNSNSNNSNSNNSNSNNSNSNNSNSDNSYSNVSNSIENNVYVDSSVCKKVFNFLLGGRSINNSTREWEDLFKCQMKSGAYSDTPFLVVTAALLQSIIPIAIGQQWSLFNRFKSNRTTTTKSVNAEVNSKTGQQG